jgi:hypothetical protein
VEVRNEERDIGASGHFPSSVPDPQ